MNSSRIFSSSLSNSPAASWPKKSEIELGPLVWCRRSHAVLGARVSTSTLEPSIGRLGRACRIPHSRPREPSRLRVSALALRMVQVDFLCKNLSWAALNNTSNSSSHRRTIAASTSDAAGGVSFGSEGSTSRAHATFSPLDLSGIVLMSFRFVRGVSIVPARSSGAGLRKRFQKTSSVDAATFRKSF